MSDTDMCPIHHTATAYTNKGCRCDWCKQANAARRKEYRRRVKPVGDKAYSMAGTEAAKWVRRHHPSVWGTLLAEAKKEARRRAAEQGG